MRRELEGLPKINKPHDKVSRYKSALIRLKRHVNQMKANYKYAVAEQEREWRRLRSIHEEDEQKEWFKSLSPELKIQARKARTRQASFFISLQNRMLETSESDLVSLHAIVNDLTIIREVLKGLTESRNRRAYQEAVPPVVETGGTTTLD